MPDPPEPTPVTDAYFDTIEEADALAATRPNSTAWTGSGKAAALQEATRRIDSLPLAGERYEPEYIEDDEQKDINSDGLAQTLEFPRVIDGVVCDWDYGTKLPIVPAAVKWACLEEAIWILQHGDDQRLENQQMGLASQSIAGSSETYVPGFGLQILQSPRARQIMRKYTGVVVR